MFFEREYEAFKKSVSPGACILSSTRQCLECLWWPSTPSFVSLMSNLDWPLKVFFTEERWQRVQKAMADSLQVSDHNSTRDREAALQQLSKVCEEVECTLDQLEMDRFTEAKFLLMVKKLSPQIAALQGRLEKRKDAAVKMFKIAELDFTTHPAFEACQIANGACVFAVALFAALTLYRSSLISCDSKAGDASNVNLHKVIASLGQNVWALHAEYTLDIALLPEIRKHVKLPRPNYTLPRLLFRSSGDASTSGAASSSGVASSPEVPAPATPDLPVPPADSSGVSKQAPADIQPTLPEDTDVAMADSLAAEEVPVPGEEVLPAEEAQAEDPAPAEEDRAPAEAAQAEDPAPAEEDPAPAEEAQAEDPAPAKEDPAPADAQASGRPFRLSNRISDAQRARTNASRARALEIRQQKATAVDIPAATPTELPSGLADAAASQETVSGSVAALDELLHEFLPSGPAPSALDEDLPPAAEPGAEQNSMANGGLEVSLSMMLEDDGIGTQQNVADDDLPLLPPLSAEEMDRMLAALPEGSASRGKLGEPSPKRRRVASRKAANARPRGKGKAKAKAKGTGKRGHAEEPQEPQEAAEAGELADDGPE